MLGNMARALEEKLSKNRMKKHGTKFLKFIFSDALLYGFRGLSKNLYWQFASPYLVGGAHGQKQFLEVPFS
jgi:hypothetical protein